MTRGRGIRTTASAARKGFYGVPVDRLIHRLLYDYLVPIGMPIGNLTSQIFANIYLNELDRFVKHELRVKCHQRYSLKRNTAFGFWAW